MAAEPDATFTLSDLRRFAKGRLAGPPVTPVGWIGKNVGLVDSISRDARQWANRAEQLSCDKPGPKTQWRGPLAAWIAWQLHSAGVPCTKGRDGILARVLAVVFEAADVRVPKDMFHVLTLVFRDRSFLQARAPAPRTRGTH
jgi:hypothetical protein